MQPTKKLKANDGTMRPRLPGIADMLNGSSRDVTSHLSLSYSPTLPSAIPPATPIVMPTPMLPPRQGTELYSRVVDDVPSPFPTLVEIRVPGPTNMRPDTSLSRADEINRQFARG